MQEGSTQKQILEANKLAKRLRRQVGEAIADYNMIEAGDRVMVCLSGGKDSYGLLDILLSLKASAPVQFEVVAMHLDQAHPGYPADILPNYLTTLGIPFHIERQDTHSIVKRVIPEGKTMCSLCSRLRRGVIYRVATELGATKIALGHHREDMLETLFLNMFHGGKLKGMPPKLVSDDGRHVVIRPLAYAAEKDLAAYAVVKHSRSSRAISAAPRRTSSGSRSRRCSPTGTGAFPAASRRCSGRCATWCRRIWRIRSCTISRGSWRRAWRIRMGIRCSTRRSFRGRRGCFRCGWWRRDRCRGRRHHTIVQFGRRSGSKPDPDHPWSNNQGGAVAVVVETGGRWRRDGRTEQQFVHRVLCVIRRVSSRPERGAPQVIRHFHVHFWLGPYKAALAPQASSNSRCARGAAIRSPHHAQQSAAKN
jgi:hypothetical protein